MAGWSAVLCFANLVGAHVELGVALSSFCRGLLPRGFRFGALSFGSTLGFCLFLEGAMCGLPPHLKPMPDLRIVTCHGPLLKSVLRVHVSRTLLPVLYIRRAAAWSDLRDNRCICIYFSYPCGCSQRLDGAVAATHNSTELLAPHWHMRGTSNDTKARLLLGRSSKSCRSCRESMAVRRTNQASDQRVASRMHACTATRRPRCLPRSSPR